MRRLVTTLIPYGLLQHSSKVAQVKMRYVTSTERYKTNLARVEEQRDNVLTILQVRFPDAPATLNDVIGRLDDLDTLRALRLDALTARTVEDFQRVLTEHVR